jgi:hypothetical protein
MYSKIRENVLFLLSRIVLILLIFDISLPYERSGKNDGQAGVQVSPLPPPPPFLAFHVETTSVEESCLAPTPSRRPSEEDSKAA